MVEGIVLYKYREGGSKMTFMVMGLLFIGAVIYGAGVVIHWLEEGGY